MELFHRYVGAGRELYFVRALSYWDCPGLAGTRGYHFEDSSVNV